MERIVRAATDVSAWVRALWRASVLRRRHGPIPVLLYIRYLSRGGGAALQFEQLARHLWEPGPLALPACGFTPPGSQYGARLGAAGLPLLRVGNLSKGAAARLQLLRPLWALLGTRIVHVFLPDGAEMIRLAARAGRTVVYTEAGTPDAANPYWQPLRAALPHIAHATAVSRSGADALRSVLGYGGPVTVIESAVADTACPWQPDAARPFTVAYAGRLVPGKQVSLLLQAFAGLAARMPAGRCRLLVMGDGPDAGALQAEAVVLGVAPAVEFAGMLPNPEVRRRLAGVDLFCLPSTGEGTPSTVLEAMAAGVPVLASRVGGIPEVVQNGTTGVLVPPGDAAALAAALLALGEDPARCRALGQSGRRRYLAAFTPAVLLPRYHGVYQQVGLNAT